MQPLDPQQPSNAGQNPQPPQVPQSPYSAPQSPFNAPQPPSGPQSPYGGPGQQPPYGGAPGGGPLQVPGADKKLPAALCGILLGGFGVHKFVLGYTNEGIIMLAVSLVGGMLTCGIVTGVVSVVGLVEGIIYLTKSDQQFVEEYVTNKKPWF